MAQRGPYSKTAAKREEILAAVLELIATSGYTGATLQQIADAVGLSKPGILHHFASRDELLTAVLARRDDIDTASFPTDDAIENLLITIRHNMDVPGLVALYVALTGVATTEPEGSESRMYFARRNPKVVSILAESIRAHQASGIVPSSADPESLARLLVAASDGLQTQWLLDPTIDMARELRQLWELMTVG